MGFSPVIEFASWIVKSMPGEIRKSFAKSFLVKPFGVVFNPVIQFTGGQSNHTSIATRKSFTKKFLVKVFGNGFQDD